MIATPEIVLGPPGTGKTTTLIGVVEEELARGVPPDRIGYVSFTRRAAEEAATRAAKKFSLTAAQLPWFRTLHSLCFRLLGLSRGDVLDGKNLDELGSYAGVRITGRWSEDGTMTGFELGDRILHMHNLARVRCVPLRQQYDEDADRLPWPEVDRVSRAIQAFKEARGLLDYTDMLEHVLRDRLRPRLDVLVADEVQDQSVLQWRVVDLLSTGARRVVVAGDDDQAIYRWAGADVDRLIDMAGEVRVLGQSHRVPRAVQAVAGEVIGTVAHRRPKRWAARADARGVVVEGTVRRTAHFWETDTSGDSVLVLARNTYVLRSQVEPELRRAGVVYERNGHPSIRAGLLEAITAWEDLRAGRSVPVEVARVVYQMLSSGTGVRRGHKELTQIEGGTTVTMADLRERGGLVREALVWHEALDRLPRDEMTYILAARKRGEKLRQRPRVRVSTIHASKGGEADHVVLMREMARRTHAEMLLAPDDEARVWYVAATRARETLTIVDATTRQVPPWL